MKNLHNISAKPYLTSKEIAAIWVHIKDTKVFRIIDDKLYFPLRDDSGCIYLISTDMHGPTWRKKGRQPLPQDIVVTKNI